MSDLKKSRKQDLIMLIYFLDLQSFLSSYKGELVGSHSEQVQRQSQNPNFHTINEKAQNVTAPSIQQ